MPAVEQLSRSERLAEQGVNIDEMVSDAVSELRTDDLAEREEEPSVDELRDILGPEAEGFSDEQIVDAWKKTQEPENDASNTPGGDEKDKTVVAAADTATVVSTAPTRPWSVSGADDKAVAGAKFKFKVDDKEVEESIDGLIRSRQRLVSEQRRIAEVTQQRNTVGQQNSELQKQVAGLTTQQKTWLWALDDPTGARFLQLLERHQAHLAKQTPAEAAAAEGQLDPASREAELQGELIYSQQIWPQLAPLAREYGWQGAAPDAGSIAHLEREVNRVTRELITAEGQFITPARIQQIIQFDVPNMLMEAGWTRGSAAAGGSQRPVGGNDSAHPRVKTLTAENANLKAQLAKQRVADAPDAGDGSAPGSGNGAPNVEGATSWRQLRAVLRDPSSFQN